MYDASIGRWFVVDPLAEKSSNQTPYHFVSNNPMNRIDPDGRTDYTINRKTGEVSQVGKENKDPDRVLKTNGKGEVKYKKDGEAKVAFGNVKQGILKDGQNFRNGSTIIEVGGDGQPTETDVESFSLKLSEYVGKEIGGAYFSNSGEENISHITIGGYAGNKLRETNSHGHVKGISMGLNLKGFFHTHPEVNDKNATLYPSSRDLESRNSSLASNSNLNYYLITRPEFYGQKYPRKFNYTKY
jgi:proteasome lid subunit RPN8/RPN11